MGKRARPKSSRTAQKTRRPVTAVTRTARPGPAKPPAKSYPPLPPVAAPAAEGVARFEQAMAALHRHDFRNASQFFTDILSSFPAERALLDRARVYLDLCRREMARRPAEPRTIEERLTAATAALNNGNEALAESLARGVLADDPRHDLALYLLASVEARRGGIDQALSYLGQAIAISPEARAQARHEPDFESLRNLDAFRELTEIPPATPSGTRRPRRGRPER
jgi:tetratricopeptide (TPR) repeat protein